MAGYLHCDECGASVKWERNRHYMRPKAWLSVEVQGEGSTFLAKGEVCSRPCAVGFLARTLEVNHLAGPVERREET